MLTLYKPAVSDLWFKEKMLSDADTMSYNHAYGGTLPFPRERWAAWHKKWVENPEGKRFYRYVRQDDAFVGEIAWRWDEERRLHVADVIIYAPYRGRGYGCQALHLLCEEAKNSGIKTLYDDIAADNPAVKLFLRCGFTVAERTAAYVLVKKELL